MQLHPYAFAIVNDLFDEDLDPEFFAQPAVDAEPALAGPAKEVTEADVPSFRLLQ